MAAVQQPQLSSLESPDSEAENHVRLLSALESLTTCHDPGTEVQITADELFALFHGLRQSAERVQVAILTS